MSDPEQPNEKPFAVEIAKQGRAMCKKCKQKCVQGELRVAKLVTNPFGEGKMKSWHHVHCLFEVFQKQRPATVRMEDPSSDTAGWSELTAEHKATILERVSECNKFFQEKHGIKPKPFNSGDNNHAAPSKTKKNSGEDAQHKDNSFREFRRLVADITNVSSYLEKTELVKKLFTKGSDGSGFKGDIVLWCRLLLPGFVKRIYNLQSKQIIKLFSRIFNTDQEEMLEHLEQGDVSDTIQTYFERSKTLKPAKKSALTLQHVDEFLSELSNLTKEDEQSDHLKRFCKKCTGNDLKVIVRLIKHDLRMNAGAKHILEGVHPDAYSSYQSSRDLEAVINRCLSQTNTKNMISVMTPVLPMLAEACKSVAQAMKKCPNGMYSEIKYDGERVQVHKKGDDFKYYSRSLKPVLSHKVEHFKKFIPKAFPRAEDLILDSEILMIDTNTGKPLPFGTLGVHKKNEFQNANVCLFVFDCIYYNGEDLTSKPIKYRKKILQDVMTEIPNHVVFSEMEEIHDPDDLTNMIAKVLKLGLEGLVLKDLNSIYEPGKRHWLKVKKDYLFDGAMADSADLLVLGAWYGTGKKGGMMSVFLMGCYDETRDRFCTVTKVHTGHDDKTLERLQKELKMDKISGDMSALPKWLKCTKTMCPDFVAKDPKQQPVWEITGAEFTKHDVHTANGISIRFPRVTKIRDDKKWSSATSLQELTVLFNKSKENTDVTLLMKGLKDKEDDAPPAKKMKLTKNSKQSSTKVQLKNPLPDYFTHIKVILSEGVEQEHRDLIRYFIAYGGTVLKEESDYKKATHVIHSENIVDDQNLSVGRLNHVTIEWLKHCIMLEQVVDFKPYAVFLKGRKEL